MYWGVATMSTAASVPHSLCVVALWPFKVEMLALVELTVGGAFELSLHREPFLILPDKSKHRLHGQCLYHQRIVCGHQSLSSHCIVRN